MEIPEFNAKIVSKEEAFWTDFKERIQKQVEMIEKELKINKALIEMSEQKIHDEQNKL